MDTTPATPKTKIFFSKTAQKWWGIGGGVFGAILGYVLVYVVPTVVTFAYTGPTCINYLTVAPSIQHLTSNEFTVTHERTLRIGDTPIVSTSLCFEPKTAPVEGVVSARLVPFGITVLGRQFTISVPSLPVAVTSNIAEGKKISTAMPLTFTLSEPDSIHTYTLQTEGRSADCLPTEGAEIVCDVVALELEHDRSYMLALHQEYKDVDTVLFEDSVHTLQPLQLISSDVSDNQTVYTAPTELRFTFDQPVNDGDIILERIADEEPIRIPVTLKKDGTTFVASFTSLARETSYRLSITQAIGENGSSLAKPVVIHFITSGGPKVESVSVGERGIARNATILVTFDQPIADDVDLLKYARLEGVSGTVKKKSETQLTYTIQGGDCTAFKLIIDKGVKSGSNNESSKENWIFNGRTICGYSWIIGNSVKGRPIAAYSFGTGSKIILFTGGIHGSEPSGYTTMQAFVQYLQRYGDTIPSDKRVVVVPNTNPDGIAAGSRYNSRNVNVGRNFPTHNWSASIETSAGTLPTGGGTSPGSEPEAAALIQLVRQLKPRLAISYHARGSLVGANKFADSVAIGDIYAKTVTYQTMYYNAEEVMGYPMTGELEDWMGEEMNIPAILIELPGHTGNYFSSQQAAIKKMLAL